MKFQAFEMERWQSTYEHSVRFNLSESGVEALTLGELVEISGLDRTELEADCLIVPGEHFDMPNYVRLGFGPTTERLREALSRCGGVLDSLAGTV